MAFLLTEPQERFFEDPNFNVLLRGCTQALAAHDIPLLLMIAGTRRRTAADHAVHHRRARRRGAAGLQPPGDPVADELREAGVPLVACGKPLGLGSSQPTWPPTTGTAPGTWCAYLLSLGPPPDRHGHRPAGHPRRRGAARRVPGGARRGGPPADDALVVSGDYSRASGEAGAERLLEQAPGPGRRVRRVRPDGPGRAGRAAAGRAAGAGGRRGRRLRRLPRRRWRPARRSPRSASRGTASAPRWCGCCWPRSAARSRRR